ncbi:MAG: O-antigen ligase family protein [Thermoguttaceae bacterium]|nr:O-antigen ligase family protein [Thermoguttaceae bacterium]
MLSRYSVFWCMLFCLVMLSNSSESVYSTDQGYNSLLPRYLVRYISLARWGFWIVFILDGLLTAFRFNRITPYHGRFIIFYGIMLLSALTLVGEIRDPLVFNEIFRYVGLFAITAVIPLQLENYTLRHGLDTTLRMLFFNVVVLTAVGIAATLVASGFSFRYTGWVDNPNSFVLINIFFIAIVMANYVQKTVNKGVLIVTLVFLAYAQLASGSRNGLLGLAVVAFVFMLRSGVGLVQTMFTVGLLAVGAWLFMEFGPQSAFRITDIDQEDPFAHDTGRLALWGELWPFIKQKWLLGWGVTGRELIGLSGNSHNMYITLMIFFGIPIGIFMGLFYIWSCVSGLLTQRKRENKLSNVSYLFSAYMVTVFFTMGFEDSIFGIGSPWTLEIALAIGMVNMLLRSETVFALTGAKEGTAPAMAPPPPPPPEVWSPDDFK